METDLPRGRDQRILIVDDEEPLLELAEEILTELGYQTAVFNSSVDALAAFEATSGSIRRRADRRDHAVTLTGTQLAARLHDCRRDHCLY